MDGKRIKIHLFCEEEDGKPIIEIGNYTCTPEGVMHIFLEVRGGERPLFYVTNDSEKYDTPEKEEIRAQIRELIERLKE